MKSLTTEQVRLWCKARSIAVSDDDHLYFKENRRCLALDLPQKPYMLVALANELLPYTVDSPFQGALLWLREWGIWSDLVERAGFRVMEMLRGGSGDRSTPDENPGYLFEANELIDLEVGLLQPMLIGWDAFMVPETMDYIVATSHDETTVVLTRTREMHENLLGALKEWGVREDSDRYFRHKGIPAVDRR